MVDGGRRAEGEGRLINVHMHLDLTVELFSAASLAHHTISLHQHLPPIRCVTQPFVSSDPGAHLSLTDVGGVKARPC